MADKKFTVSPGDEIIIRVPGKSKSTVFEGKSVRRKGMIPPRRPDDFLPRRLKKRDIINFYDLGYLLTDGVWRSVDFRIVKPPRLESNGNYLGGITPFTHADIKAVRDDQIFAVPQEQWKSRFRRLTPEIMAARGAASTRYKLTIYKTWDAGYEEIDLLDFEGFSSAGLKLTADELANGLSLLTTGNHPYVDFVGGNGTYFNAGLMLSSFLWTTAYDYSAVENGQFVDFTPSPAMDIFIMPHHGETAGDAFAGTTSYYLNHFISSYSRDQFFVHHQPGDSQYVNVRVPISEHPEFNTRTSVYWKSITGARTIIKTPTAEGFDVSVGSAGTFPNADGTFGSSTVRWEGGNSRASQPVLSVVVKKDGQWFYGWYQ